jgi:hypothetical protein
MSSTSRDDSAGSAPLCPGSSQALPGQHRFAPRYRHGSNRTANIFSKATFFSHFFHRFGRERSALPSRQLKLTFPTMNSLHLLMIIAFITTFLHGMNVSHSPSQIRHSLRGVDLRPPTGSIPHHYRDALNRAPHQGKVCRQDSIQCGITY